MTTSEVTKSVFDETTPSANTPAAPVTPDVAKDSPLSALVGDGKKFKTVEDLAKSKLEADMFIDQLKDELQGIRKELETRLRAEDAIDALKKPKSDPSPVTAADLLPEINKVVKETLSQVEKDKFAFENVREANNYVIEKMGGKAEAEAFVMKKADELGVPLEWFKDMAARSPKALYSTLGLDAAPAPAQTGTKGNVNTMAKDKDSPNTAKGSKAYYESMRKEKPAIYWSAPVQKEIFEATKKGLYK